MLSAAGVWAGQQRRKGEKSVTRAVAWIVIQDIYRDRFAPFNVEKGQ